MNLFTSFMFFIFFIQGESAPVPPFPIESSYEGNNAQLDAFAKLQSSHYPGGDISQGSAQALYMWTYPGRSVQDGNLGLVNRPSVRVRQIRRTRDQLIYDIVATHDSFGRRWVGTAPQPQAKEFLLLIGCSLVYGEGLNDNQTLGHELSLLRGKGQEVYNYGMSGTGPNTYLALVESGRLPQEIRQKKGVFIYVTLDSDHIYRATGRLPSLDWLGSSPYYEIKQDQLKRNGSFKTGRPLITKALSLYQSFRRRVGLDSAARFPRLFSWDYDYHCRLVTRMRDEFLKQYPDSSFIVYAHPLVKRMSSASRECYRTQGIAVVESGDNWNGPQFEIPVDRHPSHEANKKIARELSRFIDARESEPPPVDL